MRASGKDGRTGDGSDGDCEVDVEVADERDFFLLRDGESDAGVSEARGGGRRWVWVACGCGCAGWERCPEDDVRERESEPLVVPGDERRA